MVKSPCIKVCKYDSDNICLGCRRTKKEISQWLNSTDDEKKQILKNVEERRKIEYESGFPNMF